ncbi:MAG: MBL fold metallo-hydrolase [Parcubacteria group bacterium]|nr:MBL fold metallo-hydrolase [Parcubacteria group bacterium]
MLKKIIKNKKGLIFGFFGFLILANFLIWTSVFSKAESRFLRVYFFDVGQGDAIFIETPGNNQILIDGGPTDRIMEKLGRTMPFYDHSIDLIILTHPHADHVSGLINVLKNYEVKMILMSDVSYNTAEYQEFLRLVKEKNIPVIFAEPMRWRLSSGVILDILNPAQDLQGISLKNVHDGAVVGQLKYGRNIFLLTSDIEENIEKQLVLAYGDSLNSDILKVGHHGSKTSSSPEFLKTVSPKISVISTGRKNRYGHPHQITLDRLREIGSQIFRADLDGDIEIKSNGDIMEIDLSRNNFR